MKILQDVTAVSSGWKPLPELEVFTAYSKVKVGDGGLELVHLEDKMLNGRYNSTEGEPGN
jgi:hypothetical protein